MVGAGRFELPTPGPPDRCANRAALRSDVGNQGLAAYRDKHKSGIAHQLPTTISYHNAHAALRSLVIVDPTLRCNPALRSGRSKEYPQDARYANCVGGGHEHIEDPFNKQFTAVGNGRKAEAEYDEKCRQRDYVDRR